MKNTQNIDTYFKKGHYQKQKFDNYTLMSDSALNWEHDCAFQLTPSAFRGEHKILMLDTIQLSYTQRVGGFMYSFEPPLGYVSLLLVQECRGKATIGNAKLHIGGLLFLDEQYIYTVASSEAFSATIISIPKKLYGKLIEKCMASVEHTMQDTNNVLLKTLDHVLKRYLEDPKSEEDTELLKHLESEIISVITTLFNEQTPKVPSLTRGEEIALAIRDKAYHHMDGKIDIRFFAKEYGVSEETIQKGFKSLFGFTPKRFLRLLKLNLVYKDLREGNSKMYTVSRIAQKWGFIHMGRFSQYYTELFNENPSTTLQNNYTQQNTMAPSCTSRQEEID